MRYNQTTKNWEPESYNPTSGTSVPQVIVIQPIQPIDPAYRERLEELVNEKVANTPTKAVTAENKEPSKMNSNATVEQPIKEVVSYKPVFTIGVGEIIGLFILYKAAMSLFNFIKKIKGAV